MQRFENGLESVSKSIRNSVRYVSRNIQGLALFNQQHTGNFVANVVKNTDATSSHSSQSISQDVIFGKADGDQSGCESEHSGSSRSDSSYYDSEGSNRVCFTDSHLTR